MARYRTADIEISRAGGQHVAVYSRVSANAEVVSNEEAAMLRHCSEWLPLEGHAKSWSRERELAPLQALSAGHGPAWLAWMLGPVLRFAERRRDAVPVDSAQLEKARRRLEELAAKGFLVSAESLIEECRRHASAEALAPITSIGITTRNRTAVLGRGLASYFENGQRYERSTGCVIIDDATDAESESRTRAQLIELRRQFGMAVRYAGRAERRHFAKAIVEESGASADLVEFALFGLPQCPITTGSARNSLLLATAGDRFVMVDDDSVCRLAPCPTLEHGLSLTSNRDPTEFWFYPDPETALRETQPAETDFLGLHETLLGREAAGCLPEATDASTLRLDSIKAGFDCRLRLWGGRVRGTMAGILGDSGIGSTGYLFIDAESQKRLTRSEADYLAAVRSRQVLRSVRRTTISEGTSCVAVNLGLDNRSLLPPFIPVQRNSDGLFARTLRLCFRDGYLGYLPWTVLHAPERPRQQDLEDYWRHIQQVRTADLVIHLMQASGAPHDGLAGAASLQRLGSQFEDWGSLGAAEFREVLQEQVWRSVGSVFSSRQTSEAPPAGQEFYARLRQKYADVLRRRVTEEDYLLPSDLAHLGDKKQVHGLSREIIRRFGQLLQAWPELHAAALRLRAKGVELAMPLRD
ncbi:MAG: hypothetical protein WD733_23465 [Bryobacterales bacterium]